MTNFKRNQLHAASLLLTLAAILLSATIVLAQLTPTRAESLFARQIAPNMTLQRFLELRRNEFAALDVNGDGAVTSADVEVDRARRAADSRANIISQILPADLNGDGVITRDEVRQSMMQMMAMFPLFDASKPGFAAELEKTIDQRMAADLNRDGRIDSAEMLAHAKQQIAARNEQGNPMIAAALELDEDRDGKTTEAEFLKAAEALFRKIDADGDGTISRQEIDAYRKEMQKPR